MKHPCEVVRSRKLTDYYIALVASCTAGIQSGVQQGSGRGSDLGETSSEDAGPGKYIRTNTVGGWAASAEEQLFLYDGKDEKMDKGEYGQRGESDLLSRLQYAHWGDIQG